MQHRKESSRFWRFFFQIKRKQTATIIKLLKFPIFSIKYKSGKTVYLLFNFIPIYLKKNSTVLCYYFTMTQNFGDQLNCNLFDLFGKNIKQANIKNSDIVAIGSLLSSFFRKKELSITKKILLKIKKPLIVYGSGFIEDTPTTFHLLRSLDVRAVRGYESLNKLKNFKNINIAENVVIGDPGLLAKYMVDTTNIKKRYDLGVIPHYVDKGNPLLNKINVKNSVIIDIQQNPENFLKQIAECRNIISSAMHGLIAADSLGIPNVRMVLSDKIVGGDYKYNDYYSAFNLKTHNIVNLSTQSFTDKDVTNIAENYKIKPAQVEKICHDLINIFPYKEKK